MDNLLILVLVIAIVFITFHLVRQPKVVYLSDIQYEVPEEFLMFLPEARKANDGFVYFRLQRMFRFKSDTLEYLIASTDGVHRKEKWIDIDGQDLLEEMRQYCLEAPAQDLTKNLVDRIFEVERDGQKKEQKQRQKGQAQQQPQLKQPIVKDNGQLRGPAKMGNWREEWENGKRKPNVNREMAEKWANDPHHWWAEDPNKYNLWMPNGFRIKEWQDENGESYWTAEKSHK